MSKRALIIIDVQQDFCSGGALAVNKGEEIIPVINRLQPLFSQVVATRDWHPPDHISFAANHPGKQEFETIKSGNINQVLLPSHCVAGTPGAEFHTALHLHSVNMIIHKGLRSGMDAYSAFFENDHQTPTGLTAYLSGLGIKELYLTGLALDACVFFSALDALQCGFTTFVVIDGCRGLDSPPENVKQTSSEMHKAGVKLIHAADIKWE